VPYRGRRKTHCRVCGRHRDVCGVLSARAKCFDCGLGRVAVNALQLHDHSGYYFEHWRRRCLAAFGVVLPDDPPPPR
jgi:hypothetical protein